VDALLVLCRTSAVTCSGFGNFALAHADLFRDDRLLLDITLPSFSPSYV
jgi:hypothetical protein